MVRPRPTRRSGPAVYRPTSRRPYSRPRWLPFGYLPTAIVRGSTDVGVVATGQAVKVVAVGGRCLAGAVATGAAAKVVALAGALDTATTTDGTAAKLTDQAGATATLAATINTPPPPRVQLGRCAVATAALGRAVKQVRHAGVAAAPVAALSTGSMKVATPTAWVTDWTAPTVRTRIPRHAGVCPAPVTCLGTAATRRYPRGFTLTGTMIRVATAVLSGHRTSPPTTIPTGPVIDSVITWDADVPPRCTLTVETSIDNGLTWQPVANGGHIAGLEPGQVGGGVIRTRVSMSRPDPLTPTPRVRALEIRVDIDASRDEYLPLGVFTVDDVEIGDGPDGLTINLAGSDLSAKVSRNKWDQTYVIDPGTNYGYAIAQVIYNRLPGTVFNFVSTDWETPRLFFGESTSTDPMQDALDMAATIGCELYFDPLGVCTMRNEPDPDHDVPIWTFEDISNPTITQLSRRVSSEDTYNYVVMIGEGSSLDAPIRATAINDDPASPTYWQGPYGVVCDVTRTNLITDQDQAQAAADARLLRVKGATEAVEIDVVPQPGLEPGDIVEVRRGRSRVEGRFVIDQIHTPMAATDTMHIVARRQRLT